MGETRQFVDSLGFSWQVLEIARVATAIEAKSIAGNWLYFLSRGTTRRLRAYPTEWASMSWTDLADLCAGAEVLGADAGLRPVRALREQTTAATE